MKKLSICLAFTFLALISCKNDRHTFQSNITTDIRIERLEKELFNVDPSQIGGYINQWEKSYGDFFHHFCRVTGLGSPADSGFTRRVTEFVTDRNNYRLYTRTMEVFPDLDNLTTRLNRAFSNYIHFFPGMPVPHIYTFISGFSHSAITDDSLLAIGLDRYLGPGEPLYREAGIYEYLIPDMHPERIPSDCMNFWAETEFPFNDSVNNLITNMIYQGRNLYFTMAMLPGQHDTLNLGFSSHELDYLEKNEKSMWAYLVEHKLLFNTDRFTVNKYILEGPFTTDFGRNSPARAAVWIGYRITEAFVDRKGNVELRDLMAERDYLKILNGSGYNP